MITSGLLGGIKSTLAAFLTDTCTIDVRQMAVGEFGEPVEVYSNVASSVACRVIMLDRRTSAELLSGREGMTDVHRLICPAGTALEADQRVTLSGGDVYYVVDVLTTQTDAVDAQAMIVRQRA